MPNIQTPYLSIPDFGANPTVYSVAAGNWSNPATWNTGVVPVAGDVVQVRHAVTYDANSTAALTTVEVTATGTLSYRPDITTKLTVKNFLVLSGGSLQLGTAAVPVTASAELVFADSPINLAADPESYGNGLVVLGHFGAYGTPRTSWVVLSQEPHAGDTVLHLASAVTGWTAGDGLVVPDTRQVVYGGADPNFGSQIEEVTIQSVSVDGLSVTLTAALAYDHKGGYRPTGELDFLPKVGKLSSNIKIHSANPAGNRGWVCFTWRADIDCHHVCFGGLGRTWIRQNGPDDTTFNPDGSVASYGTDQWNRNPVTFLHLIGPTTPQGNGYQYTFQDNVVLCPMEPSSILWGINLTDSHYGLVQRNVVYSWAGVGLFWDTLSSFNKIDSNFVSDITGTAARSDQGISGVGVWGGNGNNYVTNNVAANINTGAGVFSYGYIVDMTGGTWHSGGWGNTSAAIPASQGADPSQPGQSVTVNMNKIGLLQFEANEVFSCPSGTTVWWIGTAGDDFYSDAQPSTVKNFKAWNIGNRAFYGYPTNKLTIDGMVVRGDPAWLYNGNNFTQGVTCDDYMTRGMVIKNSDIRGMYVGVDAPFMVGRVPQVNTTAIQDCTLCNAANIRLSPPRSVNGDTGLSPGVLNISNPHFTQPPQSGGTDIVMSYVVSDSLGTSDMTIPQTVNVTNYNGVTTDNFNVYYNAAPNPAPTDPTPAGAHTRTLIGGLVYP